MIQIARCVRLCHVPAFDKKTAGGFREDIAMTLTANRLRAVTVAPTGMGL